MNLILHSHVNSDKHGRIVSRDILFKDFADMAKIREFLFRTRRTGRFYASDALTYLFLILGVVMMFGPVLWGVLSSFKDSASLAEFPPTLLPYTQETVQVTGYDHPQPLVRATLDDGQVITMAQVKRVGIQVQLVDPVVPTEIISLPLERTEPVRSMKFAVSNYVEPLQRFQFLTFFKNSVIVTVSATLLTVLINSMAAFALSKYEFRGRNLAFAMIVVTLLVPLSVVLVPVYWVTRELGMHNNLLGLIIPPAATPTGVFLLRQYMLSLPDDLLDAGRVDGASEWRLFWQVVLPLALPAIAVLTIFSFMWRWNDFLWPLILINKGELYTLQLGLKVFQGENTSAWNYILAMTVLTLLPVTLVFSFLQKFITTGIATTGLK